MSPCPEAAGAAADSIAAAARDASGPGTGAGMGRGIARADGCASGPRVRGGLTGKLRWLLLAVALPVLVTAVPPASGARPADTRAAAPQTVATAPAPAARHIPPASASLHVLFDEDLPPYSYKGKGAQPGARGIYPELAAEAFRRLGLAATMVPAPWARAMAELNHECAGEGGGERSGKISGERSGECVGGHAGRRIGACGLYVTAQRLLLHDFSAPLFEEHLHLVFPASATIPEALAGAGGVVPAGFDGTATAGAGGTPLAALRGMRLGVVRGWSYGDTLDAAREAGAFIAEEAGSEAQNLLKVAGGRLDGAIVTREGALWLRERLGLTSLVTMAPHPLAVLPVHLAFRRQDAQHHLLRDFDASIRDMKADGTYARIVERALNGQ
uniref:Extracellular solute-binding protein family 3 n=1 Tax=Nitratidesulfovibrio vulgaris (strain DSM 19637 / Miyazaki F) TaxID=883 RepID=B8DKH0_NITV9